MFEHWARAFLVTLISEMIIVPPLLRSGSRSRSFATVFCVNLVSHPALWFAFPRFHPYELWLAAGELCVVLFEAFVYWRAGTTQGSWRNAVAASAAGNLVSFGLGVLLLW
jgi:hypothetical protein